jgi:hypothetical protein
MIGISFALILVFYNQNHIDHEIMMPYPTLKECNEALGEAKHMPQGDSIWVEGVCIKQFTLNTGKK